MSLARASIRRPVAVGMAFVAVALFAVVSSRRLPIDLLPDVAFPRLVVYTLYPGVAPSEVERYVTERIEQVLSAVPGVERVESVSREGISIVTLRFAWGTDMDFAALNVREQLDNAQDQLPAQAQRPVIARTDPMAEPVLTLSVSGGSDLAALREFAESVVRRRLEQLDGVAQAAVVGGLEREIHVEVDPRRLASYGVTVDDVATALERANANTPGGTIRRGRYRYALRTLAEFQSVAEIESVMIERAGVRSADSDATETRPPPVMLRDLARVQDGFRERESSTRYNGRDAIGLLVFKESGANTVRVARQVDEVLSRLREEYRDMTIEVAASQAAFIEAAIDNVTQQVIAGGVLAFLVLSLFLRDARYPVAIALAMPISILTTLVLFDAFGISLNVMTLGGLALGVGLLMDNSIVVIENIFRHRRSGLPMRDAAAVGTEEVQGPIMAATLTTIAVFGPILYVEGVAGKLFGALSLAVGFSLLASIAVAITLLPALVSRWSDESELTPRLLRSLHDRFDAWFTRAIDRYERVMIRALERRRLVVGASAVLLLGAVIVAARMKRGVLPDVDQGAFQIRLTMPRGTPLDETSALAARYERMALAEPGVGAVFTRVGRREAMFGIEDLESGPGTALLDVRLKDGVSTHDVIARLRAKATAETTGVVTIETGQATAVNRLLGGSESDLSVRVIGEDLERMGRHANALATSLASSASVANVRVGSIEGQPEMLVGIDRARAASYDLDPADIANAVDRTMRGVAATQYVDFDRKIDIVVRLPDSARRSLQTLREATVHGIPLGQVVMLRESRGPAEIRRVDQRRSIIVHADVAGGDLGDAVRDVRAIAATVPAPAGVQVEVGGENEELRRAFRALAFAFVIAVLLIYMILAAEFESLILPVIILVSVPLGLVGAILALWVTGAGLNAVSLIGLIVLAGIVDNDAVIKVDFINQARRRGATVRDAIIEAGRARFRPIVINSLTAMLGVLPMALGVGAGAELQAPLAIAVFGGLFSATALTLVVVPVVYDVLAASRKRQLGAPRPAPRIL